MTFHTYSAAHRYHGARSDCNGIRTDCQSFGKISAVCNSSGCNQADFLFHAHLFKRAYGLYKSRHKRYSQMIRRHNRRCSGSGLTAVKYDAVHADLNRNLNIFSDSPRCNFGKNRCLPICKLTNLFHLYNHVIGSECVAASGMTV